MKLVLFLLGLTLPGLAQFRSIEVTFAGIGCASCVESLPSRIERMRGVTSATVDAEHSVLKLQLAEQNRVRLEQVRDAIEQDGTKAVKAAVVVRGQLTRQDGKLLLQPAGLPANYEVDAKTPPVAAAGSWLVTGEVTKLHPDSGALVIRASALERKD